ncbi:MAG TPA: S-methyl-5'-thioadenosine phosphorylase [Peptococcaceae bacterium]|jgi:5'-methylthioadenosine phosphorylase|nr:S-methyl-5'-thioadenosine phosphorylase [Clostridia bacterium]HOB81231.1 S-methyl-5'-thioadenosine phosphorylase [Peptococcaceae bacterium]HPZ70726.1 S-methyl-5'-thioadenosine phosphorylase [Peptococcaceae bacterium]HQD53317.1 S-methyl-5'-thioadenosine phosphorylase [Peptococcaceae bacterium]
MLRADLAVIGGTGVYKAEMLENTRDVEMETCYGKVNLLLGSYAGREVAFLARHGKGHSVPPHLVNYRANIRALKDLGVKKIIATAAVGSLNQAMAPLDFVIIDQFLDFTKVRSSTFFDGEQEGVRHVDVTDPYCPRLRAFLYEQAVALGLKTHQGGCYACMEGPRYETPAEIKMLKLLGGDVVGMTSVPEVVLAREAEMCYATVAMVTNYAAGIQPTKLSHQEVVDVMQQLSENISRLIMTALAELTIDDECACCRW